MNETDFRLWLQQNGKSSKVQSDTVSRIKRLESELQIFDMDNECKKDRCEHLLSLFAHTGRNDEMEKYNTNLPIGKYSLNTYSYAIRLYVAYYTECGDITDCR